MTTLRQLRSLADALSTTTESEFVVRRCSPAGRPAMYEVWKDGSLYSKGMVPNLCAIWLDAVRRGVEISRRNDGDAVRALQNLRPLLEADLLALEPWEKEIARAMAVLKKAESCVYVCADCGRQFKDGEARDNHYMSTDCPAHGR